MVDWQKRACECSMKLMDFIPKEYWPIVWEYGYVIFYKGEPIDVEKVRARMEKLRQKSAPYNQENKDED